MKLRRHTAAQKSHEDHDDSVGDSHPDGCQEHDDSGPEHDDSGPEHDDSGQEHDDGGSSHPDAVGSESHHDGGDDTDEHHHQMQQPDDLSTQGSIYDYVENDTTASEADTSDVTSQQGAGHHSYKVM